MATIGSTTKPVTLTAADRTATLTGTIDAYGPVGKFNAQTLNAAIFGPATTDFTLLNTGLIESFDTATNADYGILLATVGTIKNTGSIIADRGIAILGTKTGAYIDNTKLIHGTEGYGVYVDGNAKILNTGLIEDTDLTNAGGDAAAIILHAGGGSVTNAGTITGPNGINFENLGTGAPTAYVHNTGTITAYNTLDVTGNFSSGFIKYGIGVYSDIKGKIVNAGTIAGNHVGIVFEHAVGTVLNTGKITSSKGYGVYLNVGGTVSNTGTILGLEQGIFVGAGSITNVITNSGYIGATEAPFLGPLGTYFTTAILEIGAGTITNTGTARGTGGIGIELYAETFTSGGGAPAPGTIINAGLAEGIEGVTFYGIGGVANTGRIIGTARGVNAYSPIAQIYNSGTIEATGATYNFTTIATDTYTATALAIHGGNITNTATGRILAPQGIAIFANGADTLTNAGTIIGGEIGVQMQGLSTLQNSGLIETTGTAAEGAVNLVDGGDLTNTKTGTIIGRIAVNGRTGILTVNNAGYIAATGANYDAIGLSAGGTIINSGTIRAIAAGIITTSDAATIDNTGTIITSTASYNSGIDLNAGGLITNAGLMEGGSAIFTQEGGTIINSGSMILYRSGIYLSGLGTVRNSGLIDVTKSGYNTGIDLGGGGLVTNTGTIESGTGIFLKSAATAVNDGHITGRNGVYAKAGGTIINAGTIGASSTGIFMAAGGTIIDTGTISVAAAGFTAIYFKSGFSATSRLIISPTTRFQGATVQLNGAALEFAADGTKIGTFAPEDQQIMNAGSITIDTGAIWELVGTFTNGSSSILINDGTVKEGATDLISINGPLEGTGLIELGQKPLTFESTVAATQTLEFTGTAETLVLGDATAFHGKIEKFAIGDSIDLKSLAKTSITGTQFAKGVLTLDATGGDVELTFASPASFGTDIFVLTADGAGTAITLKKPAMTIQTPPTPPQAATLDPPLPTGTATTPTPDSLTALTMSLPAPIGIAAHLLHPTPTTLPPITLQP